MHWTRTPEHHVLFLFCLDHKAKWKTIVIILLLIIRHFEHLTRTDPNEDSKQVHARTHTAFYKVDRIARSGRFWSRSTFEAARSAWRKWHREWRDGEKSHKNKAAFRWFVNPRPQLIVWRWLEHSPNTSVLPTDLRSDLGDMRTWTEGSAKWFQLWQARQTLCTVTPCCQWD